MSQTKPEIRDKWKSENMVRVALDMKPEIRDRWRAEAEKRGVPLATMVKTAVENFLEKKIKKLSITVDILFLDNIKETLDKIEK